MVVFLIVVVAFARVAAAVAAAIEGGEHDPRLPLEVLDGDGREGFLDLVGGGRREGWGAVALLLPHLETARVDEIQRGWFGVDAAALLLLLLLLLPSLH